MSFELESMPGQNQYLILQASSDILLHKGYELEFLFSHLSLRWHLQYMCKWVAKRGEHTIINIQLHRPAANDIFAALSVFFFFFEGVDIAKGAIAKVSLVKRAEEWLRACPEIECLVANKSPKQAVWPIRMRCIGLPKLPVC